MLLLNGTCETFVSHGKTCSNHFQNSVICKVDKTMLIKYACACLNELILEWCRHIYKHVTRLCSIHIPCQCRSVFVIMLLH